MNKDKDKDEDKKSEKESIIKCPFNENHLISTFKIIPHIHKCKDGKGKIDKLLKCKNNFLIMFFNKEEHCKECKKCYKFYSNKENKNENLKININKNSNENDLISDINKYKKNNRKNSDSYSIITAKLGENNDDISYISSKSEFESFMESDISIIENNKINLFKNKEISDIDISNLSRKI